MAKIFLTIYITGMTVWAAGFVGKTSEAIVYQPSLPFTLFIVLITPAILGYLSHED
jgi:hypothetical protein